MDLIYLENYKFIISICQRLPIEKLLKYAEVLNFACIFNCCVLLIFL